MTKPIRTSFITVILVCLGMIGFGFSAHSTVLLIPRIFFMVITVISLAHIIAVSDSFLILLGIVPCNPRRLIWLPLCTGAGIGLAVFYRFYQGINLFPPTLSSFAFVSLSIGIAEEFIYRGIILGTVKNTSPFMAVIIASMAHSLYKCSLFILGNPMNCAGILYLGIYTFATGLLLGVMRFYLDNIIFPAAFHGAFDVLTYGDAQEPPWWVW